MLYEVITVDKLQGGLVIHRAETAAVTVDKKIVIKRNIAKLDKLQ